MLVEDWWIYSFLQWALRLTAMQYLLDIISLSMLGLLLCHQAGQQVAWHGVAGVLCVYAA